jgi:EAL domain-containing protein (putative c-di-GMP-specific phosphodiesterase class I)
MPGLPSLPPHLSCRACREGAGLDFEFSMAFQPIVDIETQTVFAYEALVRGPNGEPALSVLDQVNDTNRYQFDQAARVTAITLAAQLKIQIPVSINFFPNAVYRPETCIRVTLEAAHEVGFPTSQIIFEVNEAEPVGDRAHLRGIFAEYRKQGFKTAIDDFGAGYAGLSLLADFEPDLIKIDMALVRNLHLDKTRRAIIAGTVQTCRALDITVVAEGIETNEERDALRDLGITLQQGYRFARPSFASVPTPVF